MPASASAQSAFLPANSWTDLADLALESPVVIIGNLLSAKKLGKKAAPDVPPGMARAEVRMGLTAALKSPSVLPSEAAWLWQGKTATKGKLPFAKNQPFIVFGEALQGGGSAEVLPMRLTQGRGQVAWSAETEAAVRDILHQALAPGAKGLMVTRVSDAFHTRGAVPGISESQFFLATEGGSPLTLLVRRHPERPMEIVVSSSDLVDKAQTVVPKTLLWRGLACGMPPQLPEGLGQDSALYDDYAAARSSMGECGRTAG